MSVSFSDQPDPPPLQLPDPVVAAQWASLGRHALTYAGAALSAFGMSMPSWLANLTDPQVTNIVMAVMFFGGIAMSIVGVLKGRWEKWRARAITVASAKLSAEEGVPVVVTVTPAGQDNVATKVSATEQAAAPTVPEGAIVQSAPKAT